MTSDVVLSSALRANLLSLQSTQNLIDQTQLRLSTGKRVNSALDNPQNFFAAQSLGNRASDLSALLDGLGQSISTIEQSANSVEALESLVGQAESIANQARDALSAGQQEAKITGNIDLSGIDDLTAITGIDDADQLVFSYIDTDGTIGTGTASVGTTDSIDQFITDINAFRDSGSNQVFEAKLTEDGFLSIRELNGNRFEISFDDGGAADTALVSALGFSGFETNITDNTGAADTKITVSATASLESVALLDASSNIATRSTSLITLTNADGDTLFDGTAAETDLLSIGINNDAVVEVLGNSTALGQTGLDIGEATIQSLIDGINNNTGLNTLIRADFDDATGKLTISAIDSSVESIKFEVTDAGATADAQFNIEGFGFGVGDLDADAGDNESESILLGAAAGQLASLETEYNNIRDQIDLLVSDSAFRGINLLNGDNLITNFNETRTSSLTTEGTVFTSAGLGLTAANFGRTTTVDSSISQIASAKDAVRSFGGTLANDLAVIQTRQEFTNKTINNLESAADKLTLADQNAEGARLLALQTRQQLGITSLSLASQSQQAVLRLF